MKIKITKDFMLGVLAGASGVLYLTSKKFADIIRADKPVEVEPVKDDTTARYFFDGLWSNLGGSTEEDAE